MAVPSSTNSNSPLRGILRRISSRPSPQSKQPIFAVVAILVFLVILVHLPLNESSIYHQMIRQGSSSNAKAFSLLVTLQFQDDSAKKEFLEIARPMMDYVYKNEPTTLGYELLFSDKDPLQVLFLERYVDKDEAYLKIHKSSAAFLTFRPKLQALQQAGRVTMSGNSYEDSGFGFMGRTSS
ncbi:expressed unknown protein [Seminavis robusta]|uniref:ABM domain-containing protein n=1 Tax=Seminavis robusta TaxID=568900 RepID=A0A9N8H8E0_9STRA|nr:expressed unknown protein [Seminavis robusta]|eukprot:Sro166_g074190.1 n/a (181) ;mRNA; r:56160-56702